MNHLPECLAYCTCEQPPLCTECICDALRACEQRVNKENAPSLIALCDQEYAGGYSAALDAAETEVLNIHDPVVYENRRGTYCLGCMENSGQEYPTEWPCPTVIAIYALREEK